MSDIIKDAAASELGNWYDDLVATESYPSLQPDELTAARLASMVTPARTREWANGILRKRVAKGELECHWAVDDKGYKVMAYRPKK